MLKRASWLIAAAALAAAAFPEAIAPFSAAAPAAALPAGWMLLALPGIKAAEASLVRDEGVTVLRLRAAAAAGSAAHKLRADPARTPLLHWRWKVDRVVEKADLARKEGDDYAARVYVTFDLPASELSLLDRARIQLARLIHGEELPTAALCYVWDNRHPAGTAAWNPYSSRVRMIVVSSGSAEAGRWVAATRDVAADYSAAFGGRAPAITAIALSADTDQTGETVTAWFGDVRLEARP